MQNAETPPYSIDENNSHQCALSILLSDNKVAVSIFNIDANQYVFFKQKFLPPTESLAQKLSWLISADVLFKRKYQCINIVLKSGANALIPAELFSTETANACAGLNFGEQPDKILKANYLKENVNVVNLFLEDKTLNQVIAQQMPDARQFHITTPLIYYALRKNRGKTEPELYVELGYQRVWAVLLNKQELLFCNGFEFDNEEGLLQQLANLYKQLNLNPKKTPLILSGSIDSDKDNAHFLNKTFREIHFADLPDIFSYTSHLKILLTKEYSTFLHLPLCEL
ncbi:MAG: DUF3822 family protein [Prevotellaceae bacterium]|jgi:hypothetical protein|nr:DUF3822 family protein [Prevotellaceae bacterium]